MTPEFVPFPKIGRWANNKIAVTEKIDGINASIVVGDFGDQDDSTRLYGFVYLDELDREFRGGVRAGSRNRWLTRTSDNYGFAKWVQENAVELVKLGSGTHFGEWWGSGVQRGYGLPQGEKRFSLFNVGRWVDTPNGVYDKNNPNPDKQPIVVPRLTVVPTLYYGGLRDASGRCMIEESMRRLRFGGSEAARGFPDPEGVMVYFEALKTYSKAPFDPLPKGQG